MKKIEYLCLKSRFLVVILTFIFLFASINICAHTGNSSGGKNPHDSLLFDGSSGVFIKKGGTKDCGWKVKHVWGTVIGTRDTAIRNEPNECDDMKEEFVRDVVREVRGKMKEGDEVYDNDNLEMDGEAFIQLEMRRPSDKMTGKEIPTPHDYPGFMIITVKCKNFKVPSCGDDKSWFHDESSYGWDKIPQPRWYIKSEAEKKYGSKYLFNSNGPKYSIETDQCIIKNNGTKYTLEQTETGGIIKVYEGSVDIQPLNYDNTYVKNGIDDMKKLIDDYMNGRISLEEYKKKLAEGSDGMKKESDIATGKITVEAGFQCKVNEKLREVTPIDSNDDRWWDNENYNK